MEYRFLGTTGVRVSSLCMGTMSFGGDADDQTSAELFRVARDGGINFFDTADVYNGGRSEELLGRFICAQRDEVVVASKAYFPTSEDVNARGLSRYHLVRAVEASLRRLNTDRIDLFYLHRHDDLTSMEETWRAVDDLVRAGKILYPAISNFSAWQAMKALGYARSQGLSPPVCFQPMYNLAKRQAEVEILPMCESEGLAVVPYSPTGGGLLTGKYGVNHRPDGGRLIDNPMYAVRYGDEACFSLAERFASVAAESGHAPAALAIAWVAAHQGVTAPIIGTRNVDHLSIALSSVEIGLTHESELYKKISQISNSPAPATDRNEESSSHNYGSR